MKKKVATIILNRNLGILTNKLYEKIRNFNNKYTDIFVIDAGSLKKNKSKYTTWSVKTKSVIKQHKQQYTDQKTYIKANKITRVQLYYTPAICNYRSC